MWNEFPVAQPPEKEKKKKEEEKDEKETLEEFNQGLPEVRIPKANAEHCQRSYI
jgi:hypothetical protein